MQETLCVWVDKNLTRMTQKHSKHTYSLASYRQHKKLYFSSRLKIRGENN